MRRFATQQLAPRSWPIRWRLTALNVGVLALTLAVLGGVLLLQLDRALIDITADHVSEQARPALQAPQGPRGTDGPRATDGPRGPELSGRGRPPPLAPPFNLGRSATVLVGRLTGPDTGVFVFDSGGALIAATETDDDVDAWPPPTDQQVTAVLAGVEGRSIVDQQTRRALVMLWPIRTPDGSIGGALAMARSLALTDQLQARLWSILAGGTLLALLVAGAVGLRATRSALRPLDRVIRAARRIAAGKLDERLRLARRDEIGELAEAFDTMLDRLATVLGAQRRFVADAAHELRTPLTALGGMVEMLQLGADRGDQATVRRMLDTMDREIGRLGRLVTDLLTLSRLDADAILHEVPGVARLSPLVSGNAQVIAGSQNWSTRVTAVRPEYQQIQNWQLAQGGFFGPREDAEARNVALLGQTVARNLFPSSQQPVGQVIRVRNVPFTVAGVLAPKGTGFGGDQDDTILIPFETGQVRLFGSTALNSISVQAADPEQMTQLTDSIGRLLRARHRLQSGAADDFAIRNNNDLVQSVQGVSQTMTLLLGGVAAVSLVVGGIGIMNIMLVSVTERTREIGIRMAIGARASDILAQFLVEALVLSLLGGVIGIVIGVGIALALPSLAGWATVVPIGAIGLAFGFSALVGIVFGVYPARKASRLDPIDALRYQ